MHVCTQSKIRAFILGFWMSISKDTRTVRLSLDTFLLIPSNSWQAFDSHSHGEKVSSYEGENDRIEYQARTLKRTL